MYLGYGSGTNGTLDLAGNTLTIGGSLVLGQSSGTGTLVEGGGSFTAANAYVYNGNSLSLGASDAVSFLQLSGSSGTTTATGNVTGNAYVYSGSTLNLGANLGITGSLDVEDTGSVVHMNGNNISASTILLGWYDGQPVTLDRGTTPGSLTATNLCVSGGTALNLIAADSFTNVTLTGATLSTAVTGNITGNISANNSTLNLGGNLNLTGTLDVEQTGSAFHMNGNNISAYQIELGYGYGQGVSVDRGTTPGSISATYLYVAGSNFNLLPSDNVNTFYLSNGSTTLNNSVAVTNLYLENSATGTTTSSSNISGNVSVSSGSTLNLGGNLNLTGNMDVEGAGSTVNAHGFNINAGQLTVGYFNPYAVSVTNVGSILLNSLYLGNGSTMSIQGGVVNSLINLGGNSVLTVNQTNGTGLTLNGTSLSSLTINPSSMDLIFNLNTSPNWDFRWMDPSSGGNWISTLDSMIASGMIVITAPQGFEVYNSGNYTYIGGLFTPPSVVPEPSSLLLACIASLGVAAGMTWRRRHRGA